MTRTAAFLAAGFLLTALPLQAQQAGHGNHGNHGAQQGQAAHAEHGGEHGMNHDDAAHRYAPKKLLQHRDMLQLTAQQAQQLEALQERHHADCQARKTQVKAAEEAAEAALLQDAPDIAAFERYLRQAANLKVDCKVDMARTGQQALALLTAQQRTHLAHMNHGGH
jgi:Spy/CpxP family protein refolding chaperone